MLVEVSFFGLERGDCVLHAVVLLLLGLVRRLHIFIGRLHLA